MTIASLGIVSVGVKVYSVVIPNYTVVTPFQVTEKHL